jgi:hypothetical protein
MKNLNQQQQKVYPRLIVLRISLSSPNIDSNQLTFHPFFPPSLTSSPILILFPSGPVPSPCCGLIALLPPTFGLPGTGGVSGSTAGLVGVLVPLALASCICGRSFKTPLTLERSTLVSAVAEACVVVAGIVGAEVEAVAVAEDVAVAVAGAAAAREVEFVDADGGAACDGKPAGLADRACPGPAISMFISMDSAGL